MSDSADQHFELAVGLAKEALKALLLVNGGAATALIALTDKTAGAADYSMAILMFGAGAFFAVAAMVIAYLSQLHYANHLAGTKGSDGDYKRHRVFQAFAFVTVALSLVCGGVGLWLAFAAA